MKVTEAMRLVGELVKVAEEIAEKRARRKAKTKLDFIRARNNLMRAMAEELYLPSRTRVEFPEIITTGFIEAWAVVEKTPYIPFFYTSLAIGRRDALIHTGQLDAPESPELGKESREELQRLARVLTNEYKLERRPEGPEGSFLACLVFSLKDKRDIEVANFWLDGRIFTALAIMP